MTDLVISSAFWTTPPGTDLTFGTIPIEACTSTSWENEIFTVEACTETSWDLPIPLETCTSTTWFNESKVESCTSTNWLNEIPLDVCTSTSWELLSPVEACTSTNWELLSPVEACTDTSWDLVIAVDACTDTSWDLETPPVEACTSTSWENKAPVESCLSTNWLMVDTSIETCTSTLWKHADPVEQCNPVSYWPQSHERIDACTETRVFLGQDLAALKQEHVGNLRLLTGTPLDAESFSVKGSQGAHTYTLSARFLERGPWDLLEERCTEVLVDVAGVTYKFLIEAKSKSISRTACTYSAIGTSPTVRLTKAYADDICKDYAGYLLSAAVAEIAATGGFSIDYRIEDVTIPEGGLVIKRTSPMDALVSIARRMGAIVQTNPIGDTVILEYPYKVAVTQYSSQTGINTIAAETNLLSYSSRWKPTENFDSVVVAAEAEQPVKIQYNIEYRQAEQRIRVTTVPDVTEQPELLTDIILAWQVTPLGSQSEFVSECIEVKDGEGTLSGNPDGGFVSLAYVDDDGSVAGDLSIECNTVKVSDTSIKRVVLVQAAYQSKFWEYSLSTLSSDPPSKLALYIE